MQPSPRRFLERARRNPPTQAAQRIRWSPPSASRLSRWSLPVLALVLTASPVQGQSPAPLAPAPATPPRAVNPLTGTPLSLEEMHWNLEQAHLEEQLQASLLNRRKFEVERRRLEQGDAVAPSAEGGYLNLATLPPGPVPAARTPGEPAGPPIVASDWANAPQPATLPRSRVRARPPRPRPPSPPPQPWMVVGVGTRGTDWCLLVAEDGELSPVCAGEWRHGHHVDAVSAQAYSIDGHPVRLDLPAGQLHGVPAAAATGAQSLPSADVQAGPTAPSALAVEAGDPALAPLAALPASAASLRLASPQPAMQR